MVITGAASGIGPVPARMAAEKDVRLVLALRSEKALRQLTDELNQGAAKAINVVADPSNSDEAGSIVLAAESRSGGYDTWVNNAGARTGDGFSWLDADGRECFRRGTDFCQ